MQPAVPNRINKVQNALRIGFLAMTSLLKSCPVNEWTNETRISLIEEDSKSFKIKQNE